LSFYIILWNFTEQGIKSFNDCLHSVLIFKANVERRGNPYHGTFYPAGQYDAMSLIQADDDNSVRECVLEAEKQGNVSSATLKPVTREEGVKFAETIKDLLG
jgi:uncharacterized protein with GYD domain